MARPYPIKEPKTFNEQMEILKERGLYVANEAAAVEVLRRVNYYRLSAYWLTYHKCDKFNESASFEKAYGIYEFDRQFRSILLSCLEAVEINFRTQIAYNIAHMRGALGYKDKAIFKNHVYHEEMMEVINTQICRSRERFVIHHRQKYGDIYPVWVVVEIMSFGNLAKMYSNLVPSVAKPAADDIGIHHRFVKNWLHGMAVLRNICAHHGRLYNRLLPFKPTLMKNDRKNVSVKMIAP